MTSGLSLPNAYSGLRPLEIPAEKKTSSPAMEALAMPLASLVTTNQVNNGMVANDSDWSPLHDSSRLTPANMQVKRTGLVGLRKSMSNPSVAHQLSHKFSTTFGNPTVVHRPNLRARPSLHSMQEKAVSPTTYSEHDLSPQDSTAPSSFNNSGSVSPVAQLTGKTSVDSNVPPLHSFKVRNQNERPITQGQYGLSEFRLGEKSLTPIEEIPVPVTPTIVTVETTANAKIFFETHFNSLLSNQVSPRSQRRRELELRLQQAPLTVEQRCEERARWAINETGHLRQNRVLRSKTNEKSGSAGVAVAGYEIVKILGKGSFGVVRLVREADDVNVLPQNTSPNTAHNRRRSPREELSSLRLNAIEGLKSSLESQRTPPRKKSLTGEKGVYAMKVIRKSDMLRSSQEGHLRAERDFLVASEKSRWVVPLVASFQDASNLYLVMDYMVGGDFLGLLFRKDILKEKKAKWYVAEMILCVEEAHRLCWVHRDVKPDNFLIAASGHLKISDFGLAFDGHWAHDQSYYNDHRYSLMEKLGIKVDGDSIDRKEGNSVAAGIALANVLTERNKHTEKPQCDGPTDNEGILEWRNRIGKRKLARSVVGTSQYMAPEVIRGDLYDGRCDWWSIGIILYEVK